MVSNPVGIGGGAPKGYCGENTGLDMGDDVLNAAGIGLGAASGD